MTMLIISLSICILILLIGSFRFIYMKLLNMEQQIDKLEKRENLADFTNSWNNYINSDKIYKKQTKGYFSNIPTTYSNYEYKPFKSTKL